MADNVLKPPGLCFLPSLALFSRPRAPCIPVTGTPFGALVWQRPLPRGSLLRPLCSGGDALPQVLLPATDSCHSCLPPAEAAGLSSDGTQGRPSPTAAGHPGKATLPSPRRWMLASVMVLIPGPALPLDCQLPGRSLYHWTLGHGVQGQHQAGSPWENPH